MRRIIWVCVGMCSTRSLNPGVTWQNPLVSPERQDVSTRKCVAGIISRPRQHTSCPPIVFSASTAIANLLHRARMPWILEPCGSLLCDVPKIQTLAAQRRTVWAVADFCLGSRCMTRRSFLVGNVDNRDLHRVARSCVGTGGRCSVSRQKTCSSKGFRLTL